MDLVVDRTFRALHNANIVFSEQGYRVRDKEDQVLSQFDDDLLVFENSLREFSNLDLRKWCKEQYIEYRKSDNRRIILFPLITNEYSKGGIGSAQVARHISNLGLDTYENTYFLCLHTYRNYRMNHIANNEIKDGELQAYLTKGDNFVNCLNVLHVEQLLINPFDSQIIGHVEQVTADDVEMMLIDQQISKPTISVMSRFEPICILRNYTSGTILRFIDNFGDITYRQVKNIPRVYDPHLGKE